MQCLIHSNFNIHDNEVGGDKIQKVDGNTGGVKIRIEMYTIPTKVTANNDNKSSVMLFRDENGKPVMSIIIMKVVQQKTDHEIGIYMFLYMVGK